MATIFITGSADGLGLLAAKELIKQGHQVVLHARNTERGQQAMEKLPGAAEVLIADLTNMEETKALAAKANAYSTFDTVIHNAGIYRDQSRTADGLPALFVVNSLAPYILTCLMHKPQRLIYLGSDMHLYGKSTFDHLDVSAPKRIEVTYSDTKLHDVILAMAIARKWPGVFANAIDPGWVPTKMGGAGAPDDLQKGYETQVWLATSNEPAAQVSGQYFHHKRPAHFLPAAKDIAVQEEFFTICQQFTGVQFPEGE